MGAIYFSCDETPVKKPKSRPPEGGRSSDINLNKKGAGGGAEIPKIRFVEFVIKETKKGVIERSLCPRKFIWSGLGLVYFLLFENKKWGKRGGFFFFFFSSR